MSFNFDASKTQPGVTPGLNAPTVAGSTGFALGGTGAGDASKSTANTFSLMSTPFQGKPAGLFSQSLGTTLGQGTGFVFGTPPGTTTSALPMGTPITTTSSGTSLNIGASGTGINFGLPSTTPPTGFGITSTPTTGTGFNLGAPVATTTTATPGLSFGIGQQPTPGFSIGGSLTPATSATPGLSFAIPAVTTATTGFNLGSATPTTTTGFMIGTTPAASSAVTGLSVGSATASSTPASVTGFSLGTTIPATAATGFTLAKTTAATAASTIASSAPQTSLATGTTVSSSASSGNTGAMNFCQLEESINKWTQELEAQEKAFVNQALQVNAWDKFLIANGEKIVTLNQEIERVKLEQQQLEHELDYVVGQQKELQDCLEPLEKELASLSISDPDREYTYGLAKDIDTQLKRMSEDLKEIIEHLNEANRAQDPSDPIVQIGKILNAHMNSLQWLVQRVELVDQNIQQIDQSRQKIKQARELNISLV
ncbi:nuclear pore glycoprotein p62 [Cephus cinctus]|uniref:Nuclear pore glycoprotein p62 n=1 Tax=Cephus cinctus TaxID=211228 RepID=A0AAJ7BZE3_CEPCN|nr:nuclear pore glycoprotein p62 [Cephus cinctus]XP_024942040.1 nuclear pore glycoprotein p62 [Cephus cinctus]